MQTQYITALTIAGSDSGGGAGIQADLKTFSALGVYGASVITAITSQNTLGVQAVEGVPAHAIASQLESVLSDIPIHAVKIGMVGDVAAIEVIAKALKKWRPAFIVLDPVMVAKGGDPLLQAEAVQALKEILLPLASVITPNIPEAEVLLGYSTITARTWGTINSLDKMRKAAEDIRGMGCAAVLVKGGHMDGEAHDVLAAEGGVYEHQSPRLDMRHTHGTGCTLSSAIAAFLARGFSLEEAVRQAKGYVFKAIRHALPLGQGIGPVHHFHEPWESIYK
jgi:hydroxymethylpyrimidine/phosphomethylpyrimidine kinase